VNEYNKEQYLYNSSSILAVNKQVRPIAHPHNEILFLGVESGLLAIVGLMFLALFYIITLFSIGKQHALLWLAFLSPIGFQLLVSFPFYLSTIHLVLFVLLMALSTLNKTTAYVFHLSSTLKLTARMILLLLFLLYSMFIWNTLNGLLDLGFYRFTKQAHNQILEAPLNSIIWHKKAMVLARNKDFYLDMRNKNKQGILDYIQWLERQVKYNESALLYIHLAQAHLSLGNLLTVKKTLRIIKRRYPIDARSKSVRDIEIFAERIKQQYQ
jgi:O-antigen polymerase